MSPKSGSSKVKMQQKYFKKLITGILITSFTLMPVMSALVVSIPTAEAQTIGAYTSGLVPTIAQLPLCQGKLTSATSLLFGQASNTAALDASIKKASAAIDVFNQKNSLNDQIAGLGGDSIETNSPETNAKIDELNKKLDAIGASTASLDANDSCIQDIGHLVIKMLLQKITVSTVAWINGGFNGKPAFIQDPGKFFNDIAKNEILQFGGEISDPTLFPFGKLWLQNQAKSFNNKFADNARYSLNDLITQTTPQFSANSFKLNFNQGGWGAWEAMTQVPANNPLGFQIMASNEIQTRLQGTQQSVADNTRQALQAANGFLGDMRCVDSSGSPTAITQQDKTAALAARKPDPCIGVGTWQYVTPGKLVADAATSAINYPNNNLLKANDLNDAMAAILDALLSKFSSTVMEKGFANLGTQGADGSFITNTGIAQADYSSQTEKDFTPVELASSWLAANPNFNIRTDLTQALIDEQRTYSDKLAEQNKELNSTVGGKDYAIDPTTGISNAYGLIPAIDQLDYCIPGPHPGWEQDSQRTLASVTNLIQPITTQDAKDRKGELVAGAQALSPLAGVAVGAAVGSVVPVVGTLVGAAIGGAVSAFVSSLFDGDYNKTVRQFYSLQIQSLTGVATDYPDNTSKVVNTLMSKQATVQALNGILSRYADLMHIVYNSKIMPTITAQAATEFNKISGYNQIIATNNDKITAVKAVVTQLNQIKDSVDALNNEFPDGGDQYNTQLQKDIDSFGRLSSDMVNGDDIASSDNLLKQIIDEKNYVYNNLLKGPSGCEQDLQKDNQNLPTPLYQTERMDYPFPIIYKYPTTQVTIADPWNSGYSNTINSLAVNPKYGPGFLSAYSFQVTSHAQSHNPDVFKYNDCIANADGTVSASYPPGISTISCEVKTGDLMPLGDNAPPATGVSGGVGPFRSLGSTKDAASGPFEHTIGVY